MQGRGIKWENWCPYAVRVLLLNTLLLYIDHLKRSWSAYRKQLKPSTEVNFSISKYTSRIALDFSCSMLKCPMRSYEDYEIRLVLYISCEKGKGMMELISLVLFWLAYARNPGSRLENFPQWIPGFSLCPFTSRSGYKVQNHVRK